VGAPIPVVVGETFGRLTILGEAPHRGDKRRARCRCACGSERVVALSDLRAGHIRSCGCARSDLLRARNTRHGMTRRGSKAPEYVAWVSARRRCETPVDTHYAAYGGRGIRMCDRWRASFEAFFADMGPKPTPKHSLDRIDVNGHYEPGNCRWADAATQARNTRRNVVLTFQGLSLCLTDWCARLGLKRGTLERRLGNGWPVERALTAPVDTRRGRRR
jgi:hypothetical protein